MTTFEYLCACATVDNTHVPLLGVYRPGSEAVTASFFSELTAVLKQLSTYICPIVVCGDLNIHVDVLNDSNAEKLAKRLDMFECKQHVHEPMHTAGHSLDLNITKETKISCLRGREILSDDRLVIFNVERKKIRNWSSFGRCGSYRSVR